MNMDVEKIDLDRLNAMDAPELLRYAFETFGDRAAIGTSLQKSGVVMIDLASRLALPYRVFFIETLLDYAETYELLDRVQKHYGITVERYRPRDEDIRTMREMLGQWEHFRDRRLCCQVRKAWPLARAQRTFDCWIAGLRADQSEHRQATAAKASLVHGPDRRHILKLNPLLDWTVEQIDEYITAHDVPQNALYERVSEFGERFTVISCERCHIPIMPGLETRAGKFPWESAGKKECGLHNHGSGI